MVGHADGPHACFTGLRTFLLLGLPRAGGALLIALGLFALDVAGGPASGASRATSQPVICRNP